MLHIHYATGTCPTCNKGRFVLDATLKTPWHRRLKAGVDPRGEHVTTDFEVCPGVGELATAVSEVVGTIRQGVANPITYGTI